MIAASKPFIAAANSRRQIDGHQPGERADALRYRDQRRVADRTADVAGVIIRYLAGAIRQDPRSAPSLALPAGSGTHAGLTYRIEGRGPALILLPFFLAPSQWEPALPELARHFTVIQLGGPHIGGVAALEDRARAPTVTLLARCPRRQTLARGRNTNILVSLIRGRRR